MIIEGSSTVFINMLPAARIGDKTLHGGVIITGLPSVLIGDQGGAGAGGDLPGGNSAAQVAALKRAAKDGKPFCEKCHQAALKRLALA